MAECSICIVENRKKGHSVNPGYVWSYGVWDFCDHCKGTAIEPVSGYQVVIDGRVRQIEDLTREELISELILAIDKLEEIDILQEQLNSKIQEWRAGK